MKLAKVNEAGLKFIKRELKKHVDKRYKFYNFYFASLGYAGNLEQDWVDGCDSGFEIPAIESKTGNPVYVSVPQKYFDLTEIEE